MILIGSEKVAIRPAEFWDMPNADRMSLVLKGHLSFYDEDSVEIPVGRALEILHKCAADAENPMLR